MLLKGKIVVNSLGSLELVDNSSKLTFQVVHIVIIPGTLLNFVPGRPAVKKPQKRMTRKKLVHTETEKAAFKNWFLPGPAGTRGPDADQAIAPAAATASSPIDLDMDVPSFPTASSRLQ